MATVSAVWACDVVREATAAQQRHLLTTSRQALATCWKRNTHCGTQRSAACRLQTNSANVMLAQDGSRALLLAQRRGGVVGVELLSGRTLPSVRSSHHLSRTQGLLHYLARRCIRVMEGGPEVTQNVILPRRPQPLLLHVNHLLGWCVDLQPATTLYVCSLPQLLRLRPRHLTTLQPGESVLSYRYVEWDNWREVRREPGWCVGVVGDATVRALLRGELTVDAIETWLE